MRIIYEPRGRALEYAPLAASLYRGCAHGCRYCYVPASTRTTPEKFLQPVPRKDALRLLEKDAEDLARTGDTREILMSFTTDPYQRLEEAARLTRAAIEILIHHGLHFTILTKAGTRSIADTDLLMKRRSLCRYGTTLVFDNETDRRYWEPGAAPTEDRIDALKWMHFHGIRTWVSLEPIFCVDQAMNLIEASLPFVDEYRIGKLNHLESGISQGEYRTFMQWVGKTLNATGTRYIFKKDLLEAAEVDS